LHIGYILVMEFFLSTIRNLHDFFKKFFCIFLVITISSHGHEIFMAIEDSHNKYCCKVGMFFVLIPIVQCNLELQVLKLQNAINFYNFNNFQYMFKVNKNSNCKCYNFLVEHIYTWKSTWKSIFDWTTTQIRFL
jgi:hypothetical protein